MSNMWANRNKSSRSIRLERKDAYPSMFIQHTVQTVANLILAMGRLRWVHSCGGRPGTKWRV